MLSQCKHKKLVHYRDGDIELESKEGENKKSVPFFSISDDLRVFDPQGIHLIVCVHGLDGSCHDLRLFRVYLETACCGANLQFLMSENNQVSSF